MARRKQVSFDAMVKYFLHNYKIPSKRDIEQIHKRLDRLESLITALPTRNSRARGKTGKTSPKSATQAVLELIKNSHDGVNIAYILERTGYEDKKVRNILFHLNKMDKIARVRRGFYKAK